MRIIDLHCYPNTEPWIKSQGPYVEALAKYWNRAWTWKQEDEVIAEFQNAGVEAMLVAFDIESVTGSPPCTNEYVARMRDAHPGVIRQAWGAVDPLKGAQAIEDAKKAIEDFKLFGFHFHPIMGHFSVDERRFYPLWEAIDALKAPVMIDVGTTGMGAGMPGGSGCRDSPRPSQGDRSTRRGFSQFKHRRGAPGLAVDRGDARRRAPQGQRLLGTVGLGAEIFPRLAQARHQEPAQRQGHVRQRLSEHPLRASFQGVAGAGLRRTR